MIESRDSEPPKHFCLSNGFKIMCSDQEKGKLWYRLSAESRMGEQNREEGP